MQRKENGIKPWNVTDGERWVEMESESSEIEYMHFFCILICLVQLCAHTKERSSTSCLIPLIPLFHLIDLIDMQIMAWNLDQPLKIDKGDYLSALKNRKSLKMDL